MEPVFFETPATLRAWFEAHSGTETEFWVGLRKKGTGRASITWPESVDQALCFGWIDGIRKSLDETSYVIRFTPRKRRSHWSAVNLRRVPELISAGVMTPAGLAAYEARDPANEAKASYEQATPAVLSPDAERQFRAHPTAWAYFARQPAWYRRQVTYWVVSAKKEETRERRLATLIQDSADQRWISQARRPQRPA